MQMTRLPDDANLEEAQLKGQTALNRAGAPYNTLTYSIDENRCAAIDGMVTCPYTKQLAQEIVNHEHITGMVNNRIRVARTLQSL